MAQPSSGPSTHHNGKGLLLAKAPAPRAACVPPSGACAPERRAPPSSSRPRAPSPGLDLRRLRGERHHDRIHRRCPFGRRWLAAPPRCRPPRRPRIRSPRRAPSRNPDPSRADLGGLGRRAGDRDDPLALPGCGDGATERREQPAGAPPCGTSPGSTPVRDHMGDTPRTAPRKTRTVPADDRPRAPAGRTPFCWPARAPCGMVNPSARPRDKEGRELPLSAFAFSGRRRSRQLPVPRRRVNFPASFLPVSTDWRGQAQGAR